MLAVDLLIGYISDGRAAAGRESLGILLQVVFTSQETCKPSGSHL